MPKIYKYRFKLSFLRSIQLFQSFTFGISPSQQISSRGHMVAMYTLDNSNLNGHGTLYLNKDNTRGVYF